MMLSTEDKNFDEHYYKDDAIDYLKALQESSEGIKKHAVQPNGVSDATAATSGNYIDFRSRKVAAKKWAPIQGEINTANVLAQSGIFCQSIQEKEGTPNTKISQQNALLSMLSTDEFNKITNAIQKFHPAEEDVEGL